MAESPGDGPSASGDGAGGSPAPPADSEPAAPQPADSEPAATPPADSEASQPADSEATPPADSEATPPADSEASQPADSEATPPADSEATPPADNEASQPADNEATPPADKETKNPAAEDPAPKEQAAEDPATTDAAQEPSDKQSATAEAKNPDGDEVTQRVLARAPLPDTDTAAIRTAANGLQVAGTSGQEAADKALKVANGTGQDWRGGPGEQFGTRATAEAEQTRVAGQEMSKLGDGLSQGADTVDALTRERVADIDDSRPIAAVARATLPPAESDYVVDNVVEDLVQRGSNATGPAVRRVQEAFEGWQVTPVQYERGPVETGHRFEVEAGKKKFGHNPEKSFGANKTEDQVERSKLSDPSLVRSYDAVRDASFQVDSGLRNLEIAGDDVPARLTADVTGWRSDTLPHQGSLYTEFLDTPTPKAGRFEGKAAWGAGGSADVRLDVGDASARARFEALAGAEGDAKLDVGSEFFGAGAGGFVGGKVSAAGFGELGGFGAGGRAEARVGIGLDAGVTIGRKDGDWVIGGKIGAALGVGGKLEGQLVIDPDKAGQTLQDLGSAIVEGFRNPGPSIPHSNFF
ncbi:hypothetical protein [Amycolatopsis sp. 195334CR]|uniref:hypothetical protein n=1 Tax=Amycolatopsis sp. 195334CR TaxID=2814588 RepID=UPI001A8F1D4A|nr:hypothetical protein [Amycolatopsis sp. 195334CR]MBN6039088.1 hypothetical protein [Amycolatopsis sp. 195334CR]